MVSENVEEINTIQNSKIKNSEITQVNVSVENLIVNNNKISVDKFSTNIIVDEIIKEKIESIKNKINNGKGREILTEIKSYMSKGDFHKLKPSYQIEFFYLKAIIIFNEGDYVETRAIAELINNLQLDNVRYYQLICELAIIEDDDEEFTKSIKMLEKNNIDEIEIKIYKMKQLYSKKMYLKLIEEYDMKDKFSEELMKRDIPVGIVVASYMEIGQVNNAKIVMQRIIKINTSYYIKYLYAIVNLGEIFDEGVSNLGLSTKDKVIIKENLKLLNSLKDYFNINNVYRKSYYFYLLKCILLLNPAEVIKVYDELEEDLKEDINIKIIYGDSFIFTDRYEEAKVVWYSMKEYIYIKEILIRVIDSLAEDKKYKEILKLLENKNVNEYDEEGFLAARYVVSYINENKDEDKYKIIEKLEKDFSEMPLFYVGISQLLFKEYKETEMAFCYMRKAITLSKNSREMVKMIISQVSSKIGMKQEAINLLINAEIKNKESKLFLINLVNQKQETIPEEQEKIEKIIDEFIEAEEELYLMFCYKADTLIRKNKYEEALIYFDKAFEINNTELVSYHCIITKFEVEDYNNIEKYIYALEKSNNPQFLIIVALAYKRINDIIKAYEVAYKAFKLLEGNYDEMVYANSIQLLLPSDFKRQINFDEVKENMVVTLKKDMEIKYICIDMKEEKVLNKKFFNGCEHYDSDSIIANLLLGKNKEEQVEIEDKKYTIVEITDKYIFCFRYAMNEYIKRGANPQFIRAVAIDEKEPLKEIREAMKENREHTQIIIDTYRMKEESIGLPIKILVQRLSGEYNELMKGLLYDTEGVLYAGELNKKSINECVITLTSLVSMKLLRLEDMVLQYKEKIHITKSTIDLITSKFTKARNEKSSGRMGMDKEGKLYMIEITEDIKKENIEFWRDILILSKQFVIEDYSNDYENGNIFDMVERADYDSIGLAQVRNIDVIVDDLFLRKLNLSIYKKNNTNNITHFIFNSEIKLNEILYNLKNISKTQYVYCINIDIIKTIIEEIKDKSEYSRFEEIIQNFFKTKDMFLYHIELFINAIHELDENNVYTKSMIKAIKIIVSNIKEYGRKYEINEIYLKFRFLKVNLESIVTPRIEYLNKLYDSSN